jgi:hypothetical protein
VALLVNAVLGETGRSGRVYGIENARWKGTTMNRKYLWLVATVLLVGLLLTTMLATAQEARPRRQWEYNIVVMPWSVDPTNAERIETKLNELGEDGWELISWGHLTYVLKRPVGNQP